MKFPQKYLKASVGHVRSQKMVYNDMLAYMECWSWWLGCGGNSIG